VHTKLNRSNVSLHGSDAQALYMEITCISSIVWTSALSLDMKIACS